MRPVVDQQIPVIQRRKAHSPQHMRRRPKDRRARMFPAPGQNQSAPAAIPRGRRWLTDQSSRKEPFYLEFPIEFRREIDVPAALIQVLDRTVKPGCRCRGKAGEEQPDAETEQRVVYEDFSRS